MNSPGPWRWDNWAHEQQWLLRDATGSVILRVPNAGIYPRLSNSHDPFLIAAAPDLLAVLRKVTAELRGWIISESNGDPGEFPAVAEAEALLRRIDGGDHARGKRL